MQLKNVCAMNELGLNLSTSAGIHLLSLLIYCAAYELWYINNPLKLSPPSQDAPWSDDSRKVCDFIL
jgi:hypothetical protein